MGIRDDRQPLRLLWVFVFGFLFSLAVVGGFFLLFAAQAAGQWAYWAAEPALGQDELFGVARNAVTLAAALGVGITLFFSYRKQQTAERSQQLAVQAQETAAKAQELATRTLQLSMEKHELDRVTEFRNRYARSAEQLASDKTAVQLAGLHSLAALTDDWVRIGNTGEQQVCISLICSFLRSAKLPEEAGQQMVIQAASDIALDRLKTENAGTVTSWSNCKIDLSHTNFYSGLRNLLISGGSLILRNVKFRASSSIRNLLLENGSLTVEGDHSVRRFPSFASCQFSGGLASMRANVSAQQDPLTFQRCRFSGSHFTLIVEAQEAAVLTFVGCDFLSGTVTVTTTLESVAIKFIRCTFASTEVVELRQFSDGEIQPTFKDCRFVDGASSISSPMEAVTLESLEEVSP